MTVFDYLDYKIFLKDFLKQLGRRGAMTELAKTAGCTHSYLSQVINGKPELTPDQALLMTEALQLLNDEISYFLNLVLLSRSSSPQLRAYYGEQLKVLKTASLQLDKALKATIGGEIHTLDRDIYYGSWIIPAVHILTSCEGYQTAAKISAKLNLSLREVISTLDWLVQRSLIQKKENSYIHSGKNIHLPTESVHNRTNHLNWALKVLEKSDNSRTVQYTSAFAVSACDVDLFRKNVLQFIENQRKDVSKSGSEEVLVFCCDLLHL